MRIPELDRDGFSRELDQTETVQPPEQISEPFDPDQIDIKTKNPTVDLLLARLRRGVLKLDPDFQRKMGIWNDARQSQLIESLLLRIPLPTFYAAETDSEESWEMVDGIQRLTAIARFIEPELIGGEPLVLTDLQYLKHLDGCAYHGLPGGLRTRLHETEIGLHLIGLGTPPEVKFNIFARINTGGVPLTLQELRHALIPGPARSLLRELAEQPSFLSATQGSVSDARMSDREMVLRFLAFRLIDPGTYRDRDLDEFLRRSMTNINGLTVDRVASLRRDFVHAMRAAERIFGQHAFRKQRRQYSGRNPINKALFETVAVNLAQRDDQRIHGLATNHERVNEALVELLEDPDFERAVSVGTGDRAKVRLRFARVDEMFTTFEKIDKDD